MSLDTTVLLYKQKTEKIKKKVQALSRFTKFFQKALIKLATALENTNMDQMRTLFFHFSYYGEYSYMERFLSQYYSYKQATWSTRMISFASAKFFTCKLYLQAQRQNLWLVNWDWFMQIFENLQLNYTKFVKHISRFACTSVLKFNLRLLHSLCKVLN